MRVGARIAVMCLVWAGFACPGWADDDAGADREIEEMVRASYPFRSGLHSQVVVKASAGAVTLSGTVRDWRERETAEASVRRIPGVRDVINELDISAPPRERADGWIALRIRSRLLMRSRVSVAHTDVHVQDGGVVLAGVAESPEQKALTEAYARGVQGVKWVRNEIEVRPLPEDAESGPQLGSASQAAAPRPAGQPFGTIVGRGAERPSASE